MSFLLTILSTSMYLVMPQGILEWMLMATGWFLFFCVVVGLLYYWRGYNEGRSQRSLYVLAFALITTLPASLFVGLRLPPSGALPPPNMPIDPVGSAAMFFSAIPWVFMAGMIGPISAAVVAGFSGVLLALWGTHNIFTPLELALAATVYTAAVRQRYRTPSFRILRHPLSIGLFISLLYPILYYFGASLVVEGSQAVRLDYAITHMRGAFMAFAIPLILASFFAEVFALAFPSLWGSKSGLQSSPIERSLESRLLYTLGPLVVIMDLVLVITAWRSADQTARQMIQARLANLAQVSSQQISYFLETGQSLITQLANDPRLYDPGGSSLNTILMEDLRAVPFFSDLYLLEGEDKSLAGHPDVYEPSRSFPDEVYGIRRALDGVPFQVFVGPAPEKQESARVSFVAAVFDADKNVRAVLIGRTNLERNPFSGPVLDTLRSLHDSGGMGILLDERGQILYHPDPGMVLKKYTGKGSDQEGELQDEIGSQGTRQLVYYQPALGRPWTVVLQIPAQQAQQLAITIATPLSLMVFTLSIAAALFFHFNLRKITASLQNLSTQAVRISQGELDIPLQIQGEDEVGRLGGAFEHMRSALKISHEEQKRLLSVSQGIASSLEMDEAIQPVLESTLANGACGARVVLSKEALPEFDGNGYMPVAFAAGPGAQKYTYLDEQVLTLTRQRERVILNSPYRPKLFNYPMDASIPQALLAMPIYHENRFYGALWSVYDQPHQFTEDEVRFQAALAGQAALAASNSRHYLNAEMGRLRLAAILRSTLDPVLVIDQNNRLLLANPAAWQTLGLGMHWKEGQPIDKVINQPDLLTLLVKPSKVSHSNEIILADGKVYSATISNMVSEGKQMGRVCVFKDITYFKELDKLKTDFVESVSHDLRSPLTMMRGYTTMLDMVGSLNESQVAYVHKILASVEAMTQLVNNLLDLGRLEAGLALKLKLIPVRELVENVMVGLQSLAAQRRLQLSLEIPDQTLPYLEADDILLRQALHNLIDNAINFTPADGKVRVRVKAIQDSMSFEVSDTGIGIAHVDQPHIFEKFYRVGHPGMDQEKGSGLGLAIVKSIAERHGGEINVTSQLGKGSTFILTLPLRQPRTNKEAFPNAG